MDVKFIDLPEDFDPRRPRRMGFSFGDVKKIARALNGPLIGTVNMPGAEHAVTVRLFALDFEAISVVAYWGLFRFDGEITTEKTEELIADYNVRKQDPYEFVNLLMKALRAGGHLPKDKDEPLRGSSVAPLAPMATRDSTL